VTSINIMLAIDEFSEENGASLAVPGTHQRLAAPDPEYPQGNCVSIQCSPG
jgi:ectoine hydroxylase-related dioxygenase (phytanoyl-CoA dioxygenase family)